MSGSRMADAKRRLAATLSADLAGYSQLMGDDERAMPVCPNLAISGRSAPSL